MNYQIQNYYLYFYQNRILKQWTWNNFYSTFILSGIFLSSSNNISKIFRKTIHLIPSSSKHSKLARIEIKFPLCQGYQLLLKSRTRPIRLIPFYNILSYCVASLFIHLPLSLPLSLRCVLSPLSLLIFPPISSHLLPSYSSSLSIVFELRRFFTHFNIFNCESTHSETRSGARFSTEKKQRDTGEHSVKRGNDAPLRNSILTCYALVRFNVWKSVWKSVISIVILVLVPSRERHLRVTNASQRAQNDEKELIDSSGGLYAWELYFVSAIDGCLA